MNTAIIAVVSALSLVGVGTTTVAMSDGMMNDHPMMGDGGMGNGKMGDGMHDNGEYHGEDHGERHRHCCCGDEGGEMNQERKQLKQGR